MVIERQAMDLVKVKMNPSKFQVLSAALDRMKIHRVATVADEARDMVEVSRDTVVEMTTRMRVMVVEDVDVVMARMKVKVMVAGMAILATKMLVDC